MKLALGTAQFGIDYGVSNTNGETPLDKMADILEVAKISDVKFIDTAFEYGNAEKKLGKIGLTDFKIITKLPAENSLSAEKVTEWLTTCLDCSIGKLKCQSLYALLFHRSETITSKNVDEINDFFFKKSATGLVKKVGVSVYNPDELSRLDSIGFDYQIVQIPFNILDRRFLTTGWFSILKDRGVEIHSRSCFLQGLLLMKNKDRPAYFNKWRAIWSQWDEYLFYSKVSPVEASLAFTLSSESIDKVIVGVNNLTQLRELLKIANRKYLSPFDFPDIATDDRMLINPSFWRLA